MPSARSRQTRLSQAVLSKGVGDRNPLPTETVLIVTALPKLSLSRSSATDGTAAAGCGTVEQGLRGLYYPLCAHFIYRIYYRLVYIGNCMAFRGGWDLRTTPPLKGLKKKFWGLGVGKYFFVRPWVS